MISMTIEGDKVNNLALQGIEKLPVETYKDMEIHYGKENGKYIAYREAAPFCMYSDSLINLKSAAIKIIDAYLFTEKAWLGKKNFA